MNTRCTVLLNTHAGRIRAAPSMAQIQQMARDIGLDAEVRAVPSTEAMRPLVRELVRAGCEKVAVAGGDGTVALAVQELAQKDTILGILPLGTFNNFATALRLPQDLHSALRVLRDGVVQEVSLGKIGDYYFTEAAGVGLFADALAFYGAGTVKNFGRGLYALLRVAFSFRSRNLRLCLDGELMNKRAVMCTAANTYRMGYAFPVAPQARLTDDVLDVVIVGDLMRNELLPYFRAFRAQLPRPLSKATTYRAKEIRIEAKRRLNVHCDDRIVGVTPVTITVQPRVLKVLVDRL